MNIGEISEEQIPVTVTQEGGKLILEVTTVHLEELNLEVRTRGRVVDVNTFVSHG